MRRCVALDTGYRAFPRPQKANGDVQAFALLELLQAAIAELESARRLVRAAEATVGADRPLTLAGLLESLDVAVVNSMVVLQDGEALAEDMTRTIRALQLDAQIALDWDRAQTRRGVA